MCEIFEARLARNGRGRPESVSPPLKAQSGQTGRGDGAPLALVEGAHGVTLTEEAVALQGTGGKPGQGYPAVLISSSPASPARTCPWPESGPVSPVSAQDSSLSLSECWAKFGPAGSSSRMSLGLCHRIEDVTSPSFSVRWPNSGMAWRGEYLIAATSEFPSGAAECTLSDVLEDRLVPQRYYLSPKAAAGILRRAERRGKKLPPRLERALQATAGSGTT